jgi:DNA-directed RNA polymerase subunit RPC12/RpoP
MNVACAGCGETLKVSSDQVGRSVRCPSCQSVMQVQPRGQVTDAMVRCPGCSSKLIVPDSSGAATFRCPKCGQFLATAQPNPFATSEPAVDLFSGAGGDLPHHAASSHPSSAPHAPMGFSAAPHPATPVKHSSTQWKSTTYYSERINSVPPGVILLIWAIVGLLINAVQFFYALGITDPERLAEPEVWAMKIFFIVSSSLGGLYMIAIAMGASQMIMRQRLWAGQTACILTVLPVTVFAYGNLRIGVVLYPFAVAVAIWGLVVLFNRAR